MKTVKTYTLPVVTKADQVGEFKYHTLGAIAGIKLIKSLEDKELRACMRFTKTFFAINSAIGPNTNYNWTKGQAASEMYDRDLIDHEELHMLTR